MMPILTIAFALLSNAVDLARLFVPAPKAPAAITFYFQNRHEEQTFALLDDNGEVRSDMLKPFSHFVRCWRTEREKAMYPRTIEIVAAISQHFGDARVEIVSGYRAKPYGAPHSKHFIGRAMDIHVDGVPAKQVAAWVWKNFRHVGVGYYPKQEFVHVDSRDDDVRWIDMATHGESAKARYFGRLPSDELPADAPVIAFDRAKAQPVAQVAQVSRPLPSAMAATTIASILE